MVQLNDAIPIIDMQTQVHKIIPAYYTIWVIIDMPNNSEITILKPLPFEHVQLLQPNDF